MANVGVRMKFLAYFLVFGTLATTACGQKEVVWPPPAILEWTMPMDPFALLSQGQKAELAQSAQLFSEKTQAGIFILCVPNGVFTQLGQEFFDSCKAQGANFQGVILIASVNTDSTAVLYTKSFQDVLGTTGAQSVARLKVSPASDMAGTLPARVAQILKAISTEVGTRKSLLLETKTPAPFSASAASGFPADMGRGVAPEATSSGGLWKLVLAVGLIVPCAFVLLVLAAARAEKSPVDWRKPSLSPLRRQLRKFCRRTHMEWIKSKQHFESDEPNEVVPAPRTDAVIPTKRPSLPEKRKD